MAGRLVLCALLLCLLQIGPVWAVDVEPFPTYNQSPLAQIHGVPALRPARVLDSGSRRLELAFEAANHFVHESRDGEILVLDGETHRSSLGYVIGLAERWELGVELPFLSQSSGFLDDFIEEWHDVFGLPQNGRDHMPADRLSYYYRRDADVLLDLQEPTDGLGDARVSAGWQWLRGRGLDLALRAQLKLPTGDADQLLGSGASDLAVWLVVGCSPLNCPGRFGWQAGGGVAFLGKGEVLSDLQTRTAVFGSAVFGWQAGSRIVLKAQLSAHSPLYDGSRIRALDTPSGQLILGGTWLVTPHTAIDIGVSEDVVVDTGPDVSLLLALRTLF